VWKGWRTIWTDANFDRAALPAENQMRDSGRFAGLVDPLNLYVTTFGNVTGILQPYQTGATWTSAGQFFHDNSTNGGGRSALTQDVIDLLAAMGRTANTARYGIEFFVGNLNMGTGTAVSNVGADGTTRYLATVNNSQAISGPGNRATFVGWVRAKTGSAHLNIAAVDTWVGGVKATNNIVLPANTWVHVRQIATAPLGYDNGFPRVYATAGANIQFACPAMFAGEVDVGIHTAPIATSPVLKDVLAIQPSSSAGWDDLSTVAISSGVLTLNLANPAAFKVTLNQNITSVVFQNIPSGKSVAFTVEFLQDATGRRTITWPSAVRAADGSTPFQPLSNPNARTVMTFVTSDAGATIWQNTDVQTSGGLPMPRTAATIRSVAGAINGTALSTMAATSQRIVLVPFTVSRDMDITQLGVSVSTAATGTGSLAIYASDGDSVLGTPGTRLIATATGALNTGTVGTKAAAAAGKLLAGQVYYAAMILSAAATVRALALAGACPLGFTDNAATAVMYYFLTGSAVTLPASLAGVALSTATTVPPAIYLIE